MQKDFDRWNKEKKNIHNDGSNKFYKAKEIWWCSLGLNVGFEQDGTNESYQRPVLVIKGFSRQVCLAVALTTSKKKNPYHISVGIIDGQESFAILSQIRLIDTKRFTDRLLVLDTKTFNIIRKAIKDLI
jgi:mRNA interferase MazF